MYFLKKCLIKQDNIKLSLVQPFPFQHWNAKRKPYGLEMTEIDLFFALFNLIFRFTRLSRQLSRRLGDSRLYCPPLVKKL